MKTKDLTPDNISIRSKRSKVYVDPDTEHFGDVLAGWAIGSDEMSKGSVKIQATNERILLGDATEPLTGIGVFIGKDGTDYEFRAGDPDNDYIHWDGSTLTIRGLLNADDITAGVLNVDRIEAGTIVADKIKDKAITVSKMYEDKLYFRSTFESLDSWTTTKSGVNSRTRIGSGTCELRAGNDIGDITRINTYNYSSFVRAEKSPNFQVLFHIPGSQYAIDASIMIGDENCFDPFGNSFGFYWNGTDYKLYARVVENSTPTDTEITGFATMDPNLLRAEFDYVANEIRFYLDGVLKHTASATGISVSAFSTIVAGIKNITGVDFVDFIISNLIFSQDNKVA